MTFFGHFSKVRVRLFLGFSLAFLSMALFGVLSYRHFLGLERNLLFLSQADGMVNMALEARRYEKNYFLYRQPADYNQAISYLDKFAAMLAAYKDHLVANQGKRVHARLKDLAGQYRRRFIWVHGNFSAGAETPQFKSAVEKLRASGKELILRLESLAREERGNIAEQMREYLPLLVAFLAFLICMGAALAYSLVQRLVRPLKTLEKATEVVAAGDYQTISWGEGKDEIASLVLAFNRMVGQLRHNNEQMIQTEKLTALGTLTSGVAHELNNPLNNISTSCQILEEELGPELSPDHRELLGAIDGQVEKARDIVSSLLEFARQREFELKPQNLRPLVQDTLKLVRGEKPAGVEVQVLVPSEISLAMDKAHMLQALLNLVMNAYQAMDRGGVLTIAARRLIQSEWVELVVSDTGPGIPPEYLPRVFDPFFTTKEVGRGTGLGLSIVYGVVERHQGHIEVASRPGSGTRFTITLPMKPERS